MKAFFLLFAFYLFINNTFSQTPINPASIDIVRDSFGVPHIFAKTDPEVAYGLAWAEAEDEFASMQQLLLPVKGLTGKVFGKKLVAADYAFALFRCKEITEEKWNTLSPAFVNYITGYVQALNHYAATHKSEVLNKNLFPITLKEYVSSSVFALTIFNGAGDALQRIFNNTEPQAPEYNKKGSNSAAVLNTKTTTGESFLLINAHQPNTGAQAFYEAHICSEEGLNVLGGLLAGAPSILHGVNENLGWAHTVNYCDRIDEYQLEMNPNNALQYKFDGQWIDLEVKSVKLGIKGIPIKINRKIYWSKYGATMKNKTGFFSIRLGANMKIGALDQWYQMDKAKNYTEFYAALSKQELSMFNIMYADKHDTIFYINNAAMPVRNSFVMKGKKVSSTKDSLYFFKWQRTLPGNTSTTLWTKFREIKKLPQYVNPKSGFLFNTNHSSFLATAKEDNLNSKSFEPQDGWETYHLNRSVRFLELFPQNEKLSYEKFKAIKYDIQLPDQLQYRYKLDSMFSLNENEYPALQPLISTFKNWDKKGNIESKGAAIFLLSYEYLKKKLQGVAPRLLKKQEAVETFEYAKNYYKKYFNDSLIILGDLQKLIRGNKEYPLAGFPDLLAPQWTEKMKNGRLKSIGGDGLIMFVRFAKDGLPKIETVNMYGASSHPESKHFADQVPLYLQNKTKTMMLDKKEVYRTAERIYHPE